MNLVAAAVRAMGWIGAHDGLLPAHVAVPDGNAMSPPQLAADAPIADVLHPVQVHADPPLGIQSQLACTHGGEGGHGERCHAHEPLLRQVWLDHRVAAFAAPYRYTVGLGLD